jgi:hypothetical protein
MQRIIDCMPHSDRIHALDIRWASLGWQAAIHGAILLSSERALASSDGQRKREGT